MPNSNIKILQNNNNIIVTKKTVDWLVSNTKVDYFDPIQMKGYQRRIDAKHRDKIVEYISENFYMPSSIICSVRNEEYTETDLLYIVDGQHRIEAFKYLKESNLKRYKEIQNIEMPVIVLINPDEKTEIDTFITINKTSKKVDTSLAKILSNIINEGNQSDDLTIHRREYIATDIAWKLNYEIDSSIWFNNIYFETSAKQTEQTISLNAFVKSTKQLIACFERHHIISSGWETIKEIDAIEAKCIELINFIWENAVFKWDYILKNKNTNKSIILGPIGYNSINKVVIHFLDYISKNKKFGYGDVKDIIQFSFDQMIDDKYMWLPGERFSRYSSESGYSFVAMELLGK